MNLENYGQELAENDKTGYSKQQIEYYKNLIVTLKTKENT